MDLKSGKKIAAMFWIKNQLIKRDHETAAESREHIENVIDYIAERVKIKIQNTPNFSDKTIIDVDYPEDMIALSLCLDRPILVHVTERSPNNDPVKIEEFIINEQEVFRTEYEIDY